MKYSNITKTAVFYTSDDLLNPQLTLLKHKRLSRTDATNTNNH